MCFFYGGRGGGGGGGGLRLISFCVGSGFYRDRLNIPTRPTIGPGLTPDNKGTRFLCLVLTNHSPRKLEARGHSK